MIKIANNCNIYYMLQVSPLWDLSRKQPTLSPSLLQKIICFKITFSFWLHHKACRTLSSPTRNQTLGLWLSSKQNTVSNHWTPGDSKISVLYLSCFAYIQRQQKYTHTLSESKLYIQLLCFQFFVFLAGLSIKVKDLGNIAVHTQ